MRGVWVATVYNIAIGKQNGTSEDAINDYKAEFLTILDRMEEYGMNTLYFQIRPSNDAFYKSELNPWSQFLVAPGVDPGWDKNQVDNSFALYKGQRDQADAIMSKIADVEKKVDVMSAIRPYQDALINAKIDNVALVGDFNLARRTCRMIQGELVLPSTPTVTGYASFSPCNPMPAQAAG
jgi:hypothetical protein